MRESEGDLTEHPWRRGRAAIPDAPDLGIVVVGAPTRDGPIGPHRAGVDLGGAHGAEGPTRRSRLAPIVLAHARQEPGVSDGAREATADRGALAGLDTGRARRGAVAHESRLANRDAAAAFGLEPRGTSAGAWRILRGTPVVREEAPLAIASGESFSEAGEVAAGKVAAAGRSQSAPRTAVHPVVETRIDARDDESSREIDDTSNGTLPRCRGRTNFFSARRARDLADGGP